MNIAGEPVLDNSLILYVHTANQPDEYEFPMGCEESNIVEERIRRKDG